MVYHAIEAAIPEHLDRNLGIPESGDHASWYTNPPGISDWPTNEPSTKMVYQSYLQPANSNMHKQLKPSELVTSNQACSTDARSCRGPGKLQEHDLNFVKHQSVLKIASSPADATGSQYIQMYPTAMSHRYR